MKERVAKIQQHADILLNAYFGLRGNIELFKPMAYEKEVVKRHASGNLARGFLVIRRSLFFSCVLDITRLSFDDDDRSPSIRNLIEAVKDDAFRKLLRDNYTRKDSFDATWADVLAKWAEFNSKHWVAPFKTIRDRWIAHLEVRKDGEEYKAIDIAAFNLKWGDPEEAALLLEPIVLGLMLVICNRGHYIGAVTEAYEKAGKAFWQVPATTNEPA